MVKLAKVTDQNATGQVAIKKRSRVPGVMITQYVEELPEGKTTPDFTRKPIALTIQEGKLAIFKAIVTGDPTPTVTWSRSNGDVKDPEKYLMKYDEVSGEHTIEMSNVSPDQADTYKCFATNQFGKAVVTVVLNIIEVGFKKNKAMETQGGGPMKTTLKRRSAVRPKTEAKQEGIDPKFWEILLCADKKDYERICTEYGVTDFRWMLKKLCEMKKEREEEQAQFVKSLSKLKPIEVKGNGNAEFEFEMELIDPSTKIFLYKDGEMVPYSIELENEMKHNLKQVGKKYVFTIRDLMPDDAGLYQVDVNDVNVFSTDFKIVPVEFIVKIQEVKAMEREDALFECVLSHPFSKIMWMGKNVPLEQGEKYDITVSEDKLIHKLLVKDCMQLDKGIYAAVAGIRSCNAWLIVEADNDPNMRGKKKVRKTTQAGGSGADLEKIAQEQQTKLQKERQERIEMAKQASSGTDGEDGKSGGVSATRKTGSGGSGSSSGSGSGSGTGSSDTSSSGGEQNLSGSLGPSTNTGQSHNDVDATRKGHDPDIPEEVIGQQHSPDIADVNTAGQQHSPEIPDVNTDGKLHFISGLSDMNVVRGKTADLACKLNRDDCDGEWYKDDNKLSSKDGLSIVKDGSRHNLIIRNSQEKDSGKYRFETEDCKTEATVCVGDLPEFDPDDLHQFSKPVIVKAGQNAAFKMSLAGQSVEVRWFKNGEKLLDGGSVKLAKESTHSRLLLKECVRSDAGEIAIQLKNNFGTIEAKSRLIVIDKPGPPGPVEVVESLSTLLEIKWSPPKDEGNSPVTHYILERQQVGDMAWKKLGEIRAEAPSYRDRNVSHGRRYCYRICAVNAEGVGEPLESENLMAGQLVFPDAPAAPKVVSAFKNCINLSWTAPTNQGGTIVGYLLEKRKKDSNMWTALNSVKDPIEENTYAVKDITEGSEYEFRVSAINISGQGEPSPPSALVCAKNPNMKPYFKDPDDFMVVRAGNSVRVKINYEASPLPEIKWLKDNEPVSPWINIINAEGSTQLVIPSSKRSDSGIYTIIAKNSVGQTSFDIEVRVTDEPKGPGPVALEQNVPGKVIVSWAPSPDQDIDDRLYYMVSVHDSHTRVWRTVADRLETTTYTAVNIEPGREYHFHVYAKNDMGLSEPSKSPTWGSNSNRVKSTADSPIASSFERPPSILVPLKVHTPPNGYKCYMTCAVRGCPMPHVSWYLDGINLNTNNDYYITNSHGVCSMFILRVTPKDSGEYKVVAVNYLGKAECSTKVVVKD